MFLFAKFIGLMHRFYPCLYSLRKSVLILLSIFAGGIADVYSQGCPTLAITPDTSICAGSFVLHSAISSGTIISRAWKPRYGLSDSTVANPTVTVAHDTFYTCTVTTSSTTNLITNGNFSQGNTGFSSGYTYANTPPPQSCGQYGILGCEGYYTVNTNPRNTHSGFAIFGDHTSGSGPMLIVNGSTSPNIGVWCQTITVQPNTNYQFSAWVSNVDQSPQPLPNLRFTINNVDAGPPFSPVVTAGVWTQFYTLWNSGVNTTVSICLTDSSTASGGNDFAIDDIAFIPVCTLIDTVHITTFINPTVTLPADTTFCDSVFDLLPSIVTGTGTFSYLWNDGNAHQLDTARQAGVYWLQVANQCALSAARDSMFIFLRHSPTVYLGPDTLVCNQPSDLITPIVTGSSPISYLWQNNIVDSTYTATSTNTYWLNVANSCGTYTDSINVKFDSRPVISSPTSYIPACFGDTLTITSSTPAGDTVTWQNGTHTPTYQVTGSGIYWYEWSNECGVSLNMDSFVYTYIGPPAASSLGPPDTLLCNGNSLTLGPTPVPPGARFVWQGLGTSVADTFANYSTAAAGPYVLTVSNMCGVLKDSITIDTLSPPPPFSIGLDQGLCVGSELTLRVSPLPASATSLLWQNGVTQSDTFLVTSAGTYTLTESNYCGSTPESVTITALLLPTVSFDSLPVFCDADSVPLSPIVTDAVSYSWSTGSNQASIYPRSSGIYRVTVSNTCGIADTSVTVTMLASPKKVYNGAVIDSCLGTKALLNGLNPEKNFLWSTGQTTSAITVTDPKAYFVVISDSGGFCPITDEVNVVFTSCETCQIAIPTAFSPNGDGRNDLFRTLFQCANESYQIRIYDRWGQVVYQAFDDTDGWDGTYKNIAQPIGVYVYFILYRPSGSSQDKTLTGNITLVR